MTTTTTTYQIIDTKTGTIVATSATRNGARRKADRLDLAYGAVRYIVRSIDVDTEVK